MSNETMDCPHCNNRVLNIVGHCPTCNGDLSNDPVVQRHLLKQKALAIAKTARARCASFGEIETALIQLGVDKGLISEIMMEVEGRTPQALVEKNALDMRYGLYWLVGGLWVSLITYWMALNSESGGIYIVAWGPVLAGGTKFMLAWLKSREIK